MCFVGLANGPGDVRGDKWSINGDSKEEDDVCAPPSMFYAPLYLSHVPTLAHSQNYQRLSCAAGLQRPVFLFQSLRRGLQLGANFLLRHEPGPCQHALSTPIASLVRLEKPCSAALCALSYAALIKGWQYHPSVKANLILSF